METASSVNPISRSDPAARVLFDLAQSDLNRRWLAKSVRTFAWVITAYSSFPYLLIGTKSVALGELVIWQNLVTLSWLAGLAALVVAAPQTDSSTAALARLRGVPASGLARVDWAVACSVPFKVLVPGLVLSTLAAAHTSTWYDMRRALLTLGAVACYLLTAAGVLGLTALWSRRLAPKRGRSLFLLVMLLPLVLERGLSMKSLPTMLGELLTLCLRLGSGG